MTHLAAPTRLPPLTCRLLPVGPQRRSQRARPPCRAAAPDSGEAFLQQFKQLSGETLAAAGGSQAQQAGLGCCGGSVQPAGEAAGAQSGTGGCGCSGSGGNGSQAEQAAAQGVIQAFGAMLSGPDGRVTREDLASAFATPLGDADWPQLPGGPVGGDGERFWDVSEVLAGAPSDLVFSHGEEGEEAELDGMVV